MGVQRYFNAQTITSNLFRICAWIFLRVIPFRAARFLLPAFFTIYITTWLLTPSSSRTKTTQLQVKAETAEVNGSAPVANEKAENGLSTPSTTTTSSVSEKPLPHGTISTLAFSLPTSSPKLRLSILLINVLLAVSAIDFITHPNRFPAPDVVYTRVGAVDPDSVKVVVRWPEPEEGAIRVLWNQESSVSALERAWSRGPLLKPTNETDWVAVGRITGLWPGTHYQYRLAYPNSTHLPYPAEPLRFKTFPDPRLSTGYRFKFLVSSCIMPNFPYLPFKGERIKGFDLLADYLWPEVPAPIDAVKEAVSPSSEVKESIAEQASSISEAVLPASTSLDLQEEIVSAAARVEDALRLPSQEEITTASTEFMLLLGDFVYADVPRWGGDELELYRRLYRRVYASPSFRKVYERLPIFNIYDDHEIYNNFAGENNASTIPFPNASSAYQTYNGLANYNPFVKGGNYYEFRHGDAAFFVLDTRRYRSSQDVPEEEPKTMLGEEQITRLYQWLDKVNSTATFKFIVSSVPFTTLWGMDAQVDSWAAFRAERDMLLDLISTVPNVFILSGDRHEFGAIEYLGGKVVELSTSPISMFYMPVIRTLHRTSKKLVTKVVPRVSILNDSTVTVESEEFLVPEEKVIKYLPLGNYKWSSIEVDTTDRQKPTLSVDVVINGKTEWKHQFVGQPVKLRSSNAIGTQITEGLKGVFDKMGLGSPSKWF